MRSAKKLGPAWHSKTKQGRRGMAQRISAKRGKAIHGVARQSKAGRAYHGNAWRGQTKLCAAQQA